MLSHATSSVVPWSRPLPYDPEEELLNMLGPVDGMHVLVIGPGGLGPMLALHRRGAAVVTTVRAERGVPVQPADAALVPRLDTIEHADAAIAYARRAIQPLNSLVLRLVPSAPSTLLQHTNRRLIESGFSTSRPVRIAGSIALLAELPMYGRLKCA